MKSLTLVNLLSLLAIVLSPSVFATYYYHSDDIQQRVIAEAKRQNLPPSLALAVAKVESNFNAQALSHAGAKGVMQIMPRTAEQVFGVSRKRLFEPDVNIKLGVKFIKQLLERYDGRLDIALSHYNGGSAVKNRQGELRVIPATQNYVDKVLATQQDYLQHDPSPILTSRLDPSGRLDVNTKQTSLEADIQSLEPHSQNLQNLQNPQIESLRALRLHNITRNYQGKRAQVVHDKAANLEKSAVVPTSRSTKIALVRQWESIYAD